MQTLKASVDGLKKIRQAREALTAETGWTLDNEQWVEEASQHLPPSKAGKSTVPGTVSIGTWKRFLSGKAIKAPSFRVFCLVLKLDWEEVVETNEIQSPELSSSQIFTNEVKGNVSNPIQDWGEAPDIPAFYGRTDELATLEQWILHDRCRLVAVLGIGGIGKTTLAVKLGMGGIGKSTLSIKLAQQIQGEFEYIIWRSLLNAPPVEDLLIDLIKFLSNQQEANLPETLSGKVLRLLHYLRQHRCLLILDNAESILRGRDRAGQYRDGYEGYGNLFKQVGETSHQSCLLLTSREKPQEIALLESKTRPVRSLPLGGLDKAEGRKIFHENGEFFGSDDEWEELIEFYNGNPLALEIVARHIFWAFDGSISSFLREGKQVFGDLRDLLNWHFNRLSDTEREIIYWLAINREPVSIVNLKEDILSQVSKKHVPESLESLERRLPIEKTLTGFTLQPVLIEYITERLVEQVYEEIEAQSPKLLNYYALMKAQSKEYIRDSQIRLIVKPTIDRVLANVSKQEFCKRLAELLSEQRETAPLNPGYLGGNVLNLLCTLETNLSNYDFTRTTVWQAHLQGKNLHHVNFAYGELAKSTFTQTLGMIFSVSISPDGKILATGDANSEVCLWNIESGQKILTCEGHTDWVGAVAFNPNGEMLVSVGDDQTVKLWCVRTGRCLKTIQNSSFVTSVAFSSDGETLAVSGETTLALWKVITGELHKSLQDTALVGTITFGSMGAVTFNPNQQVFLSSNEGVKLCNVATGEIIKFLQEPIPVGAIAISPDGQLLAGVISERNIKLWQVSTSQAIHLLEGHSGEISSIAFSSDSQILASASEDQSVKLWHVGTGECIRILKGHSARVRSVCFNPDGQTLASASEDQSVKLWELRTGQCLKTFQGHTNWIISLACSPVEITTEHGTSAILATATEDQFIRIWESATGQCIRILQGHTSQVRAIKFSPDGNFLASGGTDETVKLWDVKTGQCLKRLKGHTNWVRSIAFSSDGKLLATGSYDHTIKVWNLGTGECLRTLQGHTNWVRSVSFSLDGEILASCSYDKTLKLWKVSTGECLNTLRGHTDRIQSIAFNPRSNSKTTCLLASGSDDKSIRVWDTVTGRCLRVLQGHTSLVTSISFSVNGCLASCSYDKTVKIWDIDTGECLKTLEGHMDWIWSVVFSPDGETLASGGQDEIIRLWNVQTGNPLTTLRVPRPYEGMNITGVRGLTEAQKATLVTLGAVETYGDFQVLALQ